MLPVLAHIEWFVYYRISELNRELESRVDALKQTEASLKAAQEQVQVSYGPDYQSQS